MANNQPQQQKLQIKASDEALQGKYSNAAQISHTKDEVVLDFFFMHPPAGQLEARVILSPGHAKRLAAALAENIKRYEGQFGKIEEVEGPKTPDIGFQAE